MKDINKILEQLKKIKPEIQEKYKIKEMGVFGSYIRGEETPSSDLDILVDFYETISLFKFCALENFLSDILGKKVDLVMKDSLKPHIGKQILKEVKYL